MANTHSTLTELFIDIAEAIREKNGTTDPIVADNFPIEIENLRTGFDYINSDITTIPDYAFYGCTDLKSVDCYNLTSIGISSFEGCSNLKSVILYEDVQSIGENAFKGCNNLTIYCMFDEQEQPETWNDNWNPDGCEVVWMGGVIETWDISATEEDNVIAKLYKDVNSESSYSLAITGSGNMKDWDNGFVPWYDFRKYISYITIASSVTSIGIFAFNSCHSLESITIPSSITRICHRAFANCSSLKLINIPNDVTIIESGIFSGCTSLISATIPNKVIKIFDTVFSGCTSLKSIIIPDSVTDIGEYVFFGCSSLKSIILPNSVTSIGSYVFYNCTSLTSITFKGTIEQWNSIMFGDTWNYTIGNYTIYCTNGTISKDGTITYY